MPSESPEALLTAPVASEGMSSSAWPDAPYSAWSATCDTLHAHTQVLGKLSARIAPPEPQLQHAALRLTARGWETAPLPAPNGSGAFVLALDLHAHEAVVEHSDGRGARIPLTPNRSVGSVTRDLIASLEQLVGSVPFEPTPQEVWWEEPLDADETHATYDEAAVGRYLGAATRAAGVLAALRAPYRGRSTPVNAWWGSFDLAVNLFSGRPAHPPTDDFIMRNGMNAQEIAIGWWPGDPRHPTAAFYAYAHPAPTGFADASLAPAGGAWNGDLGEYLLEWADVIAAEDPHACALDFALTVVRHACDLCGWDPALARSAQGDPAPVT
jgi:hypothetical protein